MLSYFINKYLTNKRKSLEGKDFLNPKELYAPFKDIDLATLEDVKTGEIIKKGVQVPAETEKLMQKLKLSHLVLKS